jgi:hypothetical protein
VPIGKTSTSEIKQSESLENRFLSDQKPELVEMDRELWGRALGLLATLAGFSFAGLANFTGVTGFSST